MAAGHADSEDLALLAMDSPVPPEVAAHVASCSACSKDLSLLRSLLAADDPTGPDADESADTEAQPQVAAVADAMADGNDSTTSAPVHAAPSAEPTSGEPAAPPRTGSSINTTALVAALVIFLGAALLALLLLR